MSHVFPSWWCRAALAGFTLVLEAGGLARADLIFLKDGFVLQGRVRREGVTEFDQQAKEPIFIPKGFFLLDDGPRYIYFSPTQARIVEKKAPPVEERIEHKINKVLLLNRLSKMRKHVRREALRYPSAYLATFGSNEIQRALLAEWDIAILDLDPVDKTASLTEFLESLL